MKFRVLDARWADKFESSDRGAKVGMLLGCSSSEKEPSHKVNEVLQNHVLKMWINRPSTEVEE